jgi:hypothetical protein
MLAAYGVDVLDPAVTARRIHVLAEHLPPSARGGGEQWGAEAHLLAALVDQVAMLTWVTVKANGGKAAKPKPVPRPRAGRGAQTAPAAPAAAGVGDGKAPSWAAAITALGGASGMTVRGRG